MKEMVHNKNDKGKSHGYQEWYFIDGLCRGNYKNGDNVGYQEIHLLYSKQTIFFII